MNKNTSLRAILFVVNHQAGPQNIDITSIIKEYHQNYHSEVEVKYLFPEWEDFSQQLDVAISEYNVDTIVACGGDGTVKSVAEYIYNKKIKMGILPCGSSNGLAKNLNIPTDYYAALDIIFNSKNVLPVSAITVNDELSIHLADAGINANIVKRFERFGVRGVWGYIRAGIMVLRDFDDFVINISPNGNNIRTYKACMVVIANANMYGTGFVINHLGSLTDELFEIVIIKRLSLKGFIKMALNNWIPDPDLIHVIQNSSVEMESTSPLNLQVDGQYIGKYKKIQAKVLPVRIPIIIQ